MVRWRAHTALSAVGPSLLHRSAPSSSWRSPWEHYGKRVRFGGAPRQASIAAARGLLLLQLLFLLPLPASAFASGAAATATVAILATVPTRCPG